MATNTCVWFEIPVSDIEAARAFYGAVLGRELRVDHSGPNPMVPLSSMQDEGVSGHLYPGTPAAAGTGPTVHIAAPAGLEDAAERVRAAGGQVLSDPIPIPVGAFFYAADPDGNSIGLFA
ncbi:MAG: VOC family protein [Hasllibacter sp.]